MFGGRHPFAAPGWHGPFPAKRRFLFALGGGFLLGWLLTPPFFAPFAFFFLLRGLLPLAFLALMAFLIFNALACGRWRRHHGGGGHGDSFGAEFEHDPGFGGPLPGMPPWAGRGPGARYWGPEMGPTFEAIQAIRHEGRSLADVIGHGIRSSGRNPETLSRLRVILEHARQEAYQVLAQQPGTPGSAPASGSEPHNQPTFTSYPAEWVE